MHNESNNCKCIIKSKMLNSKCNICGLCLINGKNKIRSSSYIENNSNIFFIPKNQKNKIPKSSNLQIFNNIKSYNNVLEYSKNNSIKNVGNDEQNNQTISLIDNEEDNQNFSLIDNEEDNQNVSSIDNEEDNQNVSLNDDAQNTNGKLTKFQLKYAKIRKQNIKMSEKHKKPRSFLTRHIEDVIPREIAHEILVGKIFAIFKIIISLLFTLYGVASLLTHFFANKSTASHDTKFMFISPIISIILIVLSLFLFLYGSIQIKNYNSYSSNYHIEYSKNDKIILPNFIKNIYIRRIKNKYYMYLIAAITYTYSLILIPLLYLFKSHKGQNFDIAWWHLGTVPDVSNIIIIAWALVILISTILLINILINERRKRILEIYSNAEFLNLENKLEIEKRTKKICLIIYIITLTILVFIIVIPLIINSIKRKIFHDKK